MSPVPPFVVARYGVYFALFVAVASVWLGQRGGTAFDLLLLRAVFVFVIFTVLAFGAEAVLSVGWQPETEPQETPPPDEEEPETGEGDDE